MTQFKISYFCTMSKSSKTVTRVAAYMERMKKAMPKVKREIAVYEHAVKSGTLVKSPQAAPQFSHG